MLSPFVRSVVKALLLVGLTFAITPDGTYAQQRGLTQRQNGIAGQRAAPNGTIQTRQVGSQTVVSLGLSTASSPRGTLMSAQLQAELQLLIAQDQLLLQQLQKGQSTLPSGNSVTSSQLQAALQQQITLLKSLLQQVRNGQAIVQQSSSTQDLIAARPQAARAGQIVSSGTSRSPSGR